jgi:hypothetical protein
MKISVSSFWFLLLLSGCGRSPFLHHETAEPPQTPHEEGAKACPLSFPRSGYCAKLTWASAPSDQGANSFSLEFWEANSGSEEGPFSRPPHSVFVKLWMPAMGHGSSPVTLEEGMSGVYTATEVYFIMPGKWDVHIELMDSGKTIEEAVDTLQI